MLAFIVMNRLYRFQMSSVRKMKTAYVVINDIKYYCL